MQLVIIELFYPTCCLFSSHVKCALGSQEDPDCILPGSGACYQLPLFLLSPRARSEIQAKSILNHSIYLSSLLIFFKTMGHSWRKLRDCGL